MRFALLRRGILAAATLTTAAAPAPLSYAVVGQIAGPDGGWDYASFDAGNRVIYVAHDTHVLAIALNNSNSVKSFGELAHAHAVVPIEGRSMLLVTSGHDGTVRLFDTRTDQQLASIPVGENPDGATYDPSRGIAAVMNAKSGTVSVIDVAAGKVVRTVPLLAGLEFPQFGYGGRLFVNNEDHNVIETADVMTGKVGPTITLGGCTGPSGLGYDPQTKTLISACDNGKAAIVDARTLKLTHLIDIGKGPDAVIMDARRRRAFIPCGSSGTLTIISLDGPGGAHVAATIETAKGARTGALDETTSDIYLPTATPMAPPPGERRAYTPGTFRVLVVGRR